MAHSFRANDTLPLPPDTNPILAEMLQQVQARAADGSRFPLRDNIPVLECLMLQAWIRRQNPCRVLEIGLAYGVSTLFLCDALTWQPGSIYHVIDPYQDRDWHSIGWLNLVRAGYADRVQLHKEVSDKVLPQLHAEGMHFDFVLVDGSHSTWQVQADVEHVIQLLAPNGVIALDDIQLPSVQTAVTYLTQQGFQQLPIPAPFDKALPVRLRQMNHMHPSRVVALQQTKTELHQI